MRYIVGFLILIGLIIFVLVLIFRGAGNNGSPANQPAPMVDYANSSTVVQLTTIGPVESDQTHTESRITVGSSQATIEKFQGYQEDNTLLNRSYANNSAAYADFLRALQLAGYRLGNTDKSANDYRGYCPQGTRYVFAIQDGSNTIEQFWSSSCGTGTFKGKTDLVVSLFRAQIPDYDNLNAGVQ